MPVAAMGVATAAARPLRVGLRVALGKRRRLTFAAPAGAFERPRVGSFA